MPNEEKAKGGTRKPHRKSRNGCIYCKRRRVKCDELRPQCTRCVLFGLRCGFPGGPASSEPSGPEPPLPTAPDHESPRPPRRRRGRPRKNWNTDPATPASATISPSPGSATPELAARASTENALNIDEVELLLHFTQATAYSLIGSAVNDDPMSRFWSYNLPRIGLTYHFVLHLAYAVTAYHIVYGDTVHGSKRLKYKHMAEHHASLGLRQLTSALAHIDKDNCGAAYIAATLVCYCTFAAGPTGPGDLLICNMDTTHNVAWLPLIYGVRLIRENFDENVLFSGLMSPFMAAEPPPGSETTEPGVRKARCHREGFERLDWEGPLQSLRGHVASQTFEDVEVCLRGLDGMKLIYEATYGDKDATFDGLPENQFVFGWLYRVEKPFISCLQRKSPVALVMMAYYAVLLRTMENLWYIDGWADHILTTVRGLVEGDDATWLHWPTESLQRGTGRSRS